MGHGPDDEDHRTVGGQLKEISADQTRHARSLHTSNCCGGPKVIVFRTANVRLQFADWNVSFRFASCQSDTESKLVRKWSHTHEGTWINCRDDPSERCRTQTYRVRGSENGQPGADADVAFSESCWREGAIGARPATVSWRSAVTSRSKVSREHAASSLRGSYELGRKQRKSGSGGIAQAACRKAFAGRAIAKARSIAASSIGFSVAEDPGCHGSHGRSRHRLWNRILLHE